MSLRILNFFFHKIDHTKLLNGTKMKISVMNFTLELNAVPFSDYLRKVV